MSGVPADLTDVRAAAELINFGLARRHRPVERSEYRTLLDRYRAELRFKDVVDTMAEGLGLEVLGTPRAGIVLVPDPGGPFATRLGDLRAMTEDERLVFGLVLVAIAAFAYPHDVDFDDPEAKLVDIPRIDEFLRAAIAAPGMMAALPHGDRSRVAAEIYLDLPAFVPTTTGRRARGCTLRAVEEVCGWLVAQGAAREATALGPDTFRLTDHFRLLVGDSAGNAALEALREARAGRSTTATPAAGGTT